MGWEAGTPEPVSETTRSSEPCRMWGKEEVGMEGAGERRVRALRRPEKVVWGLLEPRLPMGMGGDRGGTQ